jgi:hypothetical protein
VPREDAEIGAGQGLALAGRQVVALAIGRPLLAEAADDRRVEVPAGACGNSIAAVRLADAILDAEP